MTPAIEKFLVMMLALKKCSVMQKGANKTHSAECIHSADTMTVF
jgi:hypothetical protein